MHRGRGMTSCAFRTFRYSRCATIIISSAPVPPPACPSSFTFMSTSEGAFSRSVLLSTPLSPCVPSSIPATCRVAPPAQQSLLYLCCRLVRAP